MLPSFKENFFSFLRAINMFGEIKPGILEKTGFEFEFYRHIILKLNNIRRLTLALLSAGF